jgi:hypothetical protein
MVLLPNAEGFPYNIVTFSWFVLFAKYNYNTQVEEDEMGWHVAQMGEKGNEYRLLLEKPEEKDH